ncbi:MAG TPA: ABC transporter substrate-binding protein, partial [Synergistales bacterium]|nr:ABC transporter substrate-binding protein [Synergistales bacterium]
MSRYFKSLLFVMALALLLTPALGALAADRELVIYSSVDEENATKILNVFSETTGIKINMVFLSSGPALSRIEAEKNNPQADLWFGAPNENHIVA